MITASVIVDNVEETIAFYTQKLGFGSRGTLPASDGKAIFGDAYLEDHANFYFNRSGSNNVLNKPQAGERVGVGVEFHIALPAEFDIDALYSRIEASGAAIVMPIMDSFWGERRFAVQDLNGYHVSFNKLTREVSEEDMIAAGIATQS